MKRHGICLFSLLLLTAQLYAQEPDLVIADFEQESYGDWKTTGTAFGTGPAKGPLPGQMAVEGFQGKGLVNSFFNGDGSTGTLTSPEFTIQRKYINFLIGGGKHPGKTCINLLIGDQVVRTSSGPNGQPGGSERLDWDDWDVVEFLGKTARVQIVDDITGGWGHVNIDQITQSNQSRGSILTRKSFTVTNRYLKLTVRTGAPMRRLNFLVENRLVYEADLELVDGEPGIVVYADVSSMMGKILSLETKLPRGSTALENVTATDSTIPVSDAQRPLVHFTSQRGWLNDPNGLVFYRGEWHLFYQHNPYGWNWGNMHWGHAVSHDLLNWEELPTALFLKPPQDMAFSGSAIVDDKNSSGFQQGAESPLIAAYTSTGRGECIVYSQDRGRTWKEYDKNPVVKHAGRDPRLLWHQESHTWVMVVYDETPEMKQAIAFYSSTNLKDWTFTSRLDGFFECPDLYPIRVDGQGDTKWVLSAADGKYVLGKFDGKTFQPDFDYLKDRKYQLWYGNFYAAQTYSDAPDGRRVQIGWASGIEFKGHSFNQQMTIPVELTLRSTAKGPRLFAWPVREWDSAPRALAGAKIALQEIISNQEMVISSNTRVSDQSPELFDLQTILEPGKASKLIITLRGTELEYDVKAEQLKCHQVTAPLPLRDGKVALRVIGDQGSLEIFGNRGEVAISVSDRPRNDAPKWQFVAKGGEGQLSEFLFETWQPARPRLSGGK